MAPRPIRPMMLAALGLSGIALGSGACTLDTQGKLGDEVENDSSVGGTGNTAGAPSMDVELPDSGPSGSGGSPVEDGSIDAGPDTQDAITAEDVVVQKDAQDAASEPPPDPCATLSLSYDFNTGPQDFTHNPTSPSPGDDPWQLGSPSGLACHSAPSCWKTSLVGNYSRCQTAQLVSPILDLSACAASDSAVQLSFWHYYRFEPYSDSKWWDGGLVQISSDGGQSWTEVAPIPAYQGVIQGAYTSETTNCNPTPDIANHSAWSGTIAGEVWTQVTINIDPAHRVAGFRFRFLFGSDLATEELGWAIDDVRVSSY